jgi:hypothetical protein
MQNILIVNVVKCFFDVKVNQSRMTRLQTNGGSRATTWLLCIVILKKEVPRSSLFSLRRDGILIFHSISHYANDLLKTKLSLQ